jgi:hypothetical protein
MTIKLANSILGSNWGGGGGGGGGGRELAWGLGRPSLYKRVDLHSTGREDTGKSYHVTQHFLSEKCAT